MLNLQGVKAPYAEIAKSRISGQKFFLSGTMLPSSKMQPSHDTPIQKSTKDRDDDGCSTEYDLGKRDHLIDPPVLSISY